MKSTKENAEGMKNSNAGRTQAERDAATETALIENENVKQLLYRLGKLKQRTISEETMSFLVCLEMADLLFNQFSHVIAIYHNADEIIDDIFCPAYNKVLSIIEKYLAQSIRDNLSELGDGTEI
ncbi:MAG: hypothetical protein LBJ63_12030 [Prevotellaceae bacterium]|jgi:hypothetical protein|nr:hypothetical protein [Prevotellaceae bacterium]